MIMYKRYTHPFFRKLWPACILREGNLIHFIAMTSICDASRKTKSCRHWQKQKHSPTKTMHESHSSQVDKSFTSELRKHFDGENHCYNSL